MLVWSLRWGLVMFRVHGRTSAMAALVCGALACVASHAGAQAVASAAAPEGPLVAVVALKEQTFVLYGPAGIVRSTGISSGLATNPTPIGIFNILEKRREHWSNIYDAEMPHMQRLTWSGIALHEGRVTGRPASHGCVRLPAAFAEDLFGITRVGMRVIIAYSKTEPVEITHDVLLAPRVPRHEGHAGLVRVASASVSSSGPLPVGPAVVTAAASTPALSGPSSLPIEALSLARKDARVQANAAAKSDDDLKKVHAALLVDMARLTKVRDAAGRAVKSAERQEAKERKALEAAADEVRGRVEKALAVAISKRTAADALLLNAEAALAAKRNANLAALREVDDAETEAKTTWEAYRRLMRIGEPVSVLISSKTGMLHVRQAFDPIFEVPVVIEGRGGALLGTHVFTLMEAGSEPRAARWSVVSLPLLPSEPRIWHVADLPPTDPPEPTASRALDRVSIPADVRARLEAVLVPGASLIVTDEAPSTETGKGTDFIVELDQPQPDLHVVREAPRRIERPASVTNDRRPAPAKVVIPVRGTSIKAFDTQRLFASDR